MCLGAIERLTDTWSEEGTPVGRLETGRVVSLAFLPDARAGSFVLLHLGIPVEVIDPEAARDALALRASETSDR